MTSPAVVWFRNDLRLADNAALTAAAAGGRPVIPVYVLDDASPGPWKMGAASRWWLERSLAALAADLERHGITLVLRQGQPEKVIADVVQESGAESVCFSRGYEPWATALEERVRNAAGAECHRYSGFLLFEPESIRTGSGDPYRVFTPFSRACLADPPEATARRVPKLASWSGRISGDRLGDLKLYPGKPDWARGFDDRWTPGEAGARKALERFVDGAIQDYAVERDRPNREGTSRLSPHLHFGEISPLTCWQAASHAASGRGAETFLKELLWREFSHHLLAHDPDMPDEPSDERFAGFEWRDDRAGLERWRRGLTGYPMVDAGMRELWATGWMHNRVRMIAASFLSKHLLIPWQEGERWFWDTLVDADIGNNAMNWQWVAGCGADAAPYFRIFNPVIQGEKFDPEGDYVRAWIPELARLPEKAVHKPWTANSSTLSHAGVTLGETYPEPMVDHAAARRRALSAYEAIRT